MRRSRADLDHGLTLTQRLFLREPGSVRAQTSAFSSIPPIGKARRTCLLQSRNTGSTALSQYNTPPPDPKLVRFADLYHPGCTKNGRAMSNRTRRSSGGDPPRRNFNLQLDFRQWRPPFTAGVCAGISRIGQAGVPGGRRQHLRFRRLPVGRSQQCATPAGPLSIQLKLGGGSRIQTPNGIPQNTVPIIADFRGRNLTIGMPASLASAFANPKRLDDGRRWESGEDYKPHHCLDGAALRWTL